MAVIGMRRARMGPWPSPSSKPFTEKPVYAAVYLNIELTMKKKIFYPPRRVMEDLEFEHACHGANLHVIKANRFVLYKRNFIKRTTTGGGTDILHPWAATTTLQVQLPPVS